MSPEGEGGYAPPEAHPSDEEKIIDEVDNDTPQARAEIAKDLKNMAIAEAKAGRFEEAKEAARKIGDEMNEARNHALGRIAMAESAAGRFKDAKETMKGITKDDQYRTDVVRRISADLFNAGGIDEAKGFVQELDSDFLRERDRSDILKEIDDKAAKSGVKSERT